LQLIAEALISTYVYVVSIAKDKIKINCFHI